MSSTGLLLLLRVELAATRLGIWSRSAIFHRTGLPALASIRRRPSLGSAVAWWRGSSRSQLLSKRRRCESPWSMDGVTGYDQMDCCTHRRRGDSRRRWLRCLGPTSADHGFSCHDTDTDTDPGGFSTPGRDTRVRASWSSFDVMAPWGRAPSTRSRCRLEGEPPASDLGAAGEGRRSTSGSVYSSWNRGLASG